MELPKLPQIDDGSDLYNWVRFIKAESKEEFEMAVKGNEYLEAAYKELEIISQDSQKRIAYTTRQKALFDYNTLMQENFERGKEAGSKEKALSIAAKLRESGIDEETIRRCIE